MATQAESDDKKSAKGRKRLHLRDVKGDGSGPLDTVGAELKAARLKRGEELEIISAKLKIRRDILEALEESKYDKHPAKVYAVGFVRSYAQYLGLDAEVMVKRYKAEIAGREQDRAPSLNFPASTHEQGFQGGGLLVMALALGGLVYGAWVYTQPEAVAEQPPIVVTEAEAERIAAAQEAALPGPLGVPADPVLFAQQLAAPEQVSRTFGEPDGQARVILRATEESYVRVRDMWDENGPKVVFEHNLQKGDVYRVPNRRGLSLRTGNAGALVIEIDGQALGTLGKPGDTADSVSLDLKRLKSRFSSGGTTAPKPDPRDEAAPSGPAPTPPADAAPTPPSVPAAPVTN